MSAVGIIRGSRRRFGAGTVASRFGLALAIAISVQGCAATQRVADDVARDRAKVVVNGVVEKNLPGVDASPVTDCVIDNASAQEILVIARDSVLGVKPDTVDLVLKIAQRPASVRCIAQASLRL